MPRSAACSAHAEQHRLPVICWLDGGGARPHDMKVEGRGSSSTFVIFARLSGLVPTVGIVPGRAFAGHANLAGMCDLLIATQDGRMGMAGPPLVEAALGVKLTPEEIGPAAVHCRLRRRRRPGRGRGRGGRSGAAVSGLFRPARFRAGEAPDQRRLRDMVPDNPRRAYDVRKVIARHRRSSAACWSCKAGFGRAMVTALARLDGRTVGVIANQPMFLAGAMDGPAC